MNLVSHKFLIHNINVKTTMYLYKYSQSVYCIAMQAAIGYI